MPSSWFHPQSFKSAILDAIDIGKETGQLAPFPFVAITVTEDGIQAYGRSSFCAGWSYTATLLRADEANTVLIDFDEGKELAQAVGKTSASRDATVWVEITDGRLVVAYGNESLADLPGIEPGEGEIGGINEELEILDQSGTQQRSKFAMGTETIKRFSKIRSKSPMLDLLFTDIGNTTFVKIGEGFIGAFEAIARDQVAEQEPKLFTD